MLLCGPFVMVLNLNKLRSDDCSRVCQKPLLDAEPSQKPLVQRFSNFSEGLHLILQGNGKESDAISRTASLMGVKGGCFDLLPVAGGVESLEQPTWLHHNQEVLIIFQCDSGSCAEGCTGLLHLLSSLY